MQNASAVKPQRRKKNQKINAKTQEENLNNQKVFYLDITVQNVQPVSAKMCH
jgi:hypothetical protein